MRQYFVLDGKSSKDYGVYISGSGTFNAPRRNREKITIPGRNGALTIDNGNYENINIEYPAFIFNDFDVNISAFRNMLLSHTQYVRLEDSYHPDEYRLALYDGDFEADVVDNLSAGEFTLLFDCYPQRYLKSGEREIEFTAAGAINNRTEHPALPLLRAYGDGSLTIGSISVVISGSDGYTDIDCELMEAYKDTLSVNKNNTITLSNGVFPKLMPGINNISFTGMTKVIITPRWWIL